MSVNLELRRKALEALQHPVTAQTGRIECWPAIESDPATSEPLFLEWCEKNGILFSLTNLRDGMYMVIVWPLDDRHSHWQRGDNDVIKAIGRSPSAARALAIVAASEAK